MCFQTLDVHVLSLQTFNIHCFPPFQCAIVAFWVPEYVSTCKHTYTSFTHHCNCNINSLEFGYSGTKTHTHGECYVFTRDESSKIVKAAILMTTTTTIIIIIIYIIISARRVSLFFLFYSFFASWLSF